MDEDSVDSSNVEKQQRFTRSRINESDEGEICCKCGKQFESNWSKVMEKIAKDYKKGKTSFDTLTIKEFLDSCLKCSGIEVEIDENAEDDLLEEVVHFRKKRRGEEANILLNTSGYIGVNKKRIRRIIYNINLLKISTILLSVACIFICIQYPAIWESINQDSKWAKVLDRVLSIRKNYPKQADDLWAGVLSGIRNSFIKKGPTVYTLVHNGTRTAPCIARIIASITNETFENSAWCLLDGLKLKGVDTRDYDYGKFAEKIEKDLAETGSGALIVTNLQHIPPRMALAFHHLCDEGNVAAAKISYIFTLAADLNGKSDTKAVEDTLNNAWASLEMDELYPLLGRLTSMVMRIVEEGGRYCLLDMKPAKEITFP